MDRNISVGDRVKVKYEDVQHKDGGRTKETVIRSNEGEVVAVPSEKFSWTENGEFDFDFAIDSGNAIRSVNIDDGFVCQLIYDAGGDRGFEKWDLEEIIVES